MNTLQPMPIQAQSPSCNSSGLGFLKMSLCYVRRSRNVQILMGGQDESFSISVNQNCFGKLDAIRKTQALSWQIFHRIYGSNGIGGNTYLRWSLYGSRRTTPFEPLPRATLEQYRGSFLVIWEVKSSHNGIPHWMKTSSGTESWISHFWSTEKWQICFWKDYLMVGGPKIKWLHTRREWDLAPLWLFV